jgi:hypothetical protein
MCGTIPIEGHRRPVGRLGALPVDFNAFQDCLAFVFVPMATASIPLPAGVSFAADCGGSPAVGSIGKGERPVASESSGRDPGVDPAVFLDAVLCVGLAAASWSNQERRAKDGGN